MDTHKIDNFIQRKEKQDYLLFQKITPEKVKVLKNLMDDFHFKYRLNRKLCLADDYTKVKELIDLFFIEREVFLNRMIENLQG